LDKNNNPQPYKITYSVDRGTFSQGDVQIGLNFTESARPSYYINLNENLQLVDGLTTEYMPDPACGPEKQRYRPALGTRSFRKSGKHRAINVAGFGITTLQGSATFQAFDFTWQTDCSPECGLNITPTVDLDAVKTIQDYDTWRPTAGRNEKDFGGGLIIEAQMYTKSTNKPTDAVLPDKWSFKLAQVSHEPGVALNWPAKANLAFPSPADLTFDDPVNHITYANTNISPDGTTMDIPLDPRIWSRVVVILDSRDWGAWATLNLNVTVAGQVIKAHFLNDTTTDILLPKRHNGSLIADSWRNAHSIPLDSPDLDDSENDPAGDGNAGDGLTLYEEYRGFYMGCARSQGYPQPRARLARSASMWKETQQRRICLWPASSAEETLGIKKFKEETKLNVHYKGLSKDEIGEDHRINFNLARAALQNGLPRGNTLCTCAGTRTRGTSTARGPGVPRKIDTYSSRVGMTH
jgi:hypothetical protein